MASSISIRAGRASVLAACLVATALLGCTSESATPALNKPDPDQIPEVGPIPENGPKLGALADIVPVLERPKVGAKPVGYLHAGAKVARSEKPYEAQGCEGGWYPVRPRGFVCATLLATTDMKHPTLAAMALAPDLAAAMPYTYARTARETPILERGKSKEDVVKEVGKLASRAGAAIVGSWSAKDASGAMQRLGLMTNGRFLRAEDLEAANPSEFQGIELGEKTELPVAFVVKQGVRFWEIGDDSRPEKQSKLDYHAYVALTGKYRSLDGLRYWSTADGKYVRHRDVTVIRRRNVYPDFATADQKWIDVSIVTGTLVAYEGKNPVFATLVSVGRDRLGDPKTTDSTAQGDFHVVAKHVTLKGQKADELSRKFQLYDVPWTLELDSGQMLQAAYWHDRFGIENTSGDVHLSPADAARIWHWATPELPSGWHGVTRQEGPKTIVHVRK